MHANQDPPLMRAPQKKFRKRGPAPATPSPLSQDQTPLPAAAQRPSFHRAGSPGHPRARLKCFSQDRLQRLFWISGPRLSPHWLDSTMIAFYRPSQKLSAELLQHTLQASTLTTFQSEQPVDQSACDISFIRFTVGSPAVDPPLARRTWDIQQAHLVEAPALRSHPAVHL